MHMKPRHNIIIVVVIIDGGGMGSVMTCVCKFVCLCDFSVCALKGQLYKLTPIDCVTLPHAQVTIMLQKEVDA